MSVDLDPARVARPEAILDGWRLVASRWVPGVPRPQTRPQVYRTGAVASDSPLCRAWKVAVRREMADVRAPPDVPLRVELSFAMPRPRRLGNEGATRPHTTRPDVDNLTKAVLDALENSIGNDGRVSMLVASKYYSTSRLVSGAIVSIYSKETEL